MKTQKAEGNEKKMVQYLKIKRESLRISKLKFSFYL